MLLVIVDGILFDLGNRLQLVHRRRDDGQSISLNGILAVWQMNASAVVLGFFVDVSKDGVNGVHGAAGPSG